MLHERIRRARILKGLSLQQVSDQLGDITKQALSKYEQGKDAPNSTRLIKLADVLGVKPEYFFRQETVALGEVDFRKHSSFGKRQQEAVKEQVREHLERYLAVERLFVTNELGPGFSRWLNAFPANSLEDIETVAELLRKEWQLGTNPIGNLTETLEENGVKVISLCAHERFDGLCTVVNDGADAVIVSNAERPGERQRFNLAHELGHLVLRLPEEMHDTKEEEFWCHRFAAAFLFPAEQVRETFGPVRRRLLLKEFLLAKAEWGMSIQAILYRLKDLGIIQQSLCQSIFRAWSAKGYRKNEPNDLESEPSFRLEQLVFRALAEDMVTPSRAAELLGCSLAKIERALANDVDEGKDAGTSSCL